MNKTMKILLKISNRSTAPNVFRMGISALNEANPDIGDLLEYQNGKTGLLKLSSWGIKGLWGIMRLCIRENGLFSGIVEAGRIYRDLFAYSTKPGLKERLFRFCINRNYGKLSIRLSKTINLDVVYKDGSIPATIAVENGRCDVLKIMLNRDSDVWQGNRDELEPILDNIHQQPKHEYDAFNLLRQKDGTGRNLVAIAMDRGGDQLEGLLVEMEKAYSHCITATSGDYWDSITTVNPFEEAKQYFASVNRVPAEIDVLNRFEEETATRDPIIKAVQLFANLESVKKVIGVGRKEEVLDMLKAMVEIVKNSNKEDEFKVAYAELCRSISHVTSINTNPGFKEKLFRFCIEHKLNRMTKWLCKSVKPVVKYKDGKTLGSLIVEYDRLDELNIILNRSVGTQNNGSTDLAKNSELFDFLNQKALNGQVNLIAQVLLRNGQNRGSMLEAMKIAYLQNTTREQKIANLNPFILARSGLPRVYAELDAIINATVLDVPGSILQRLFQSNNSATRIVTEEMILPAIYAAQGMVSLTSKNLFNGMKPVISKVTHYMHAPINMLKQWWSPKLEAKSSNLKAISIDESNCLNAIRAGIELVEDGKNEISEDMKWVKELINEDNIHQTALNSQLKVISEEYGNQLIGLAKCSQEEIAAMRNSDKLLKVDWYEFLEDKKIIDHYSPMITKLKENIRNGEEELHKKSNVILYMVASVISILPIIGKTKWIADVIGKNTQLVNDIKSHNDSLEKLNLPYLVACKRVQGALNVSGFQELNLEENMEVIKELARDQDRRMREEFKAGALPSELKVAAERIQDRKVKLELLLGNLIEVEQLMVEYGVGVEGSSNLISIASDATKDSHTKGGVQIAKDAEKLRAEVKGLRTEIENFMSASPKDMTEGYNQLSAKVNGIKKNVEEKMGHLEKMNMSVKIHLLGDKISEAQKEISQFNQKVENVYNKLKKFDMPTVLGEDKMSAKKVVVLQKGAQEIEKELKMLEEALNDELVGEIFLGDDGFDESVGKAYTKIITQLGTVLEKKGQIVKALDENYKLILEYFEYESKCEEVIRTTECNYDGIDKLNDTYSKLITELAEKTNCKNQIGKKYGELLSKVCYTYNVAKRVEDRANLVEGEFFKSLDLPESIRKNVAEKIERAQKGQEELEDIEGANGTVSVNVDKQGTYKMVIDYPDQAMLGWMWRRENYVEKFISELYVELNMRGILIKGDHVGQKIPSIQISINANSEQIKGAAKEINNALNKMIKDRNQELGSYLKVQEEKISKSMP